MTSRTAFASASVVADGSVARFSGHFSESSSHSGPFHQKSSDKNLSEMSQTEIPLDLHYLPDCPSWARVSMLSLGAALSWILDLKQTDDIVLLHGSNKVRRYYLASRKSLVREDSVVRFKHSLLDLLPCVPISTLGAGSSNLLWPVSISLRPIAVWFQMAVVLRSILPLQHPS